MIDESSSMLRICGIDLDKNEARFVVLAGHAGSFELIETKLARLGIADPKSQNEVREFRTRVQRFFDDNGVELVAIRERLSKGRMKGGTITFKLEGLIQTCRQEVVLIPPATIRKATSMANIEFSELPVAKFQHEAYGAAYCLMAATSLEPREP
ncbi:MAG: DUF3010 family protein [Acidobacteriota bacterium]